MCLEGINKINKILVLGSAGRVGRPLLQQALRAGFAVTALVRDAGRLADVSHDQLRVVEGDASVVDDLEKAFSERPDAVLSTLGLFIRSPATPMTDITCKLIAAMQKHEVSRIVVMSSLGVGESRKWGGLVEQFVVRVVLRHVLNDKALQEQVIRESGLDWTILRPPRILDSDEQKDYLRWQNDLHSLKPRWKLSRADAAREMLNLVVDESTIRQTWHASY